MSDPINAEDLHLPGIHPIDALGNGGFRFAEMSHKGNLLILPDQIQNWAASEENMFENDHYEAILKYAENLDILVLGTGAKMKMPPQSLYDILRPHNIVLEFMSTSNAARTFNVLLAENRRVAAAFIAVD